MLSPRLHKIEERDLSKAIGIQMQIKAWFLKECFYRLGKVRALFDLDLALSISSVGRWRESLADFAGAKLSSPYFEIQLLLAHSARLSLR